MKHPPIMLTDPWLISETGWAAVRAVYDGSPEGRALLDELRRDRLAAGRGMNGGNAHPLRIENGVAVISVAGPIFRKAGLFTDLSDATSDEMIRAQLAQATADPGVLASVLDIDSPGGEASGAAETAGAIRAADAIKPVVAYTGGMAASKAYWFASAARSIVAAEDAHLGCIGARRMMVDDSKADEMAGYRTYDLVSDDAPDKRDSPVDEQVIGKEKATLNAISAVFREHVARGRNTTPENVAAEFGRGNVVIAGKALVAGMIDEIGTLQTATDAARRAAMKGNAMNPPNAAATATAGQPTANMTDGTCTGCAKAMAGPDPIYCAGCAGKGDMKAQAAGKFVVDALAALEAKSIDEAIGAIAALKQEAAAAVDLRARFEQHAASARAEKFRASLSGAGPKLAVSDLLVTVPALLDEQNRERATNAIDALDPKASSESPAIIAALCGALTADGKPTLTEGEANRVGAYLARKVPQPQPPVVIEPARDPAKDAAHVETNTGRLAAIDRGFDRAIGTDPKQTAPAA